MAIPSWKLIPALVGGNTVGGLKPPKTPAFAHLQLVKEKACREAGRPPVWSTLVTGYAANCRRCQTNHPLCAWSFKLVSTAPSPCWPQACARSECDLFLLGDGRTNVIMVLDDG